MQRKMRIFFLPLDNVSVFYDDLIKPKEEIEKSSEIVDIPTWAIYIDHPNAKIIFDTGQRFLPYGERSNNKLLHQLFLCGIVPEKIDYVIMSHLHNDHAGNIGMFPNAQVVVQRQELSDALLETHTEAPYGIYHREDVDIDAKWKLVEGRYHLLDGIDLIPFPGHTRGLQGMLLSLENTGKMLVTSDACYTDVNYGPPVRLSGVSVDEKLFRNSIETIRGMAEEFHAKIVFGHDMEQFKRLRKAPCFYD